MPLPQNAKALYEFLTGNGLSSNGAAGVLGNIYGESGGNPESVGTGGNGLIGWTPPLAGAVTGNVQKDLQFQEKALLRYIAANGGEASINQHASSPTSAASYFIYQFERPANPAGDLPIRAQVAGDVAAAAKSGNWTAGPASSSASGSSGGGILGSFNPVPFILNNLGVSNFSDMLERGALILLGAIFVFVGIWKFTSMSKGKRPDPIGTVVKNSQDTHAQEADAVEDAAAG